MALLLFSQSQLTILYKIIVSINAIDVLRPFCFSLKKKMWPFFCKSLNSLYPRILPTCTLFDSIWSSGFGVEVENVKILHTGVKTDISL